MSQLATLLKDIRINKGNTIKEAAKALKIDYSLLSRYEKGDRLPTREQIEKIAKYYKVPIKHLLANWLGEKIYKDLAQEDVAFEALQVAESLIGYKRLSFENNDVIKQIDKLKKELNKLRPIPQAQLKKLLEYYKVEYTYDSNRIEGNTLTLQETALVVEKGMTISGKSVQEHLEAINHAEAVDFLIDCVKNKTEISEYLVKQIHGLVLRGIDKENAGRYRHLNVRISGSKHIPPEPYMLGKLMEEYIMFYEESRKKLHPVILAAEMHERLVTIHPFIDGNGRTSRLIMNLVLLQNGFHITNINSDRNNRMAYYSALEKVQVNNDKKPFYDFVAQATLYALEDFLKAVR